MRILALALIALTAQATVVRTLCNSGCDHATLQSAADYCALTHNTTEACLIQATAGQSENSSVIVELKAQTTANKKRIIIRSSKVQEIAARPGSADVTASRMYTVQFTGGNTGLYVAPGASWYEVHGLEIKPNTTTALFAAVWVGADGSGVAAKQESNSTSHIWLNKLYVHGYQDNQTASIQHAIYANGADIRVTNSTIEEIHGLGIETQAISSVNSVGPMEFVNNAVYGGSILSLMGGAAASIPGLIPRSTKWYANHYKMDWRYFFADCPTVGSTCTSPVAAAACVVPGAIIINNAGTKYLCNSSTNLWETTTNTPVNDVIKNGWECKNCSGVILDGMVIEQIPATGDGSQWGDGMLFNQVDNASDGMFWARPENITVMNSKFRRIGKLNGAGRIGSGYHTNYNNLRIENNLVEDSNHPDVAPFVLRRWNFFFLDGESYIFRRNTILQRPDSANGQAGHMSSAAANGVKNITVQDNIFGRQAFGIYADGFANGEGCTNLTQVAHGLRMTHGVLVNTTGGSTTMYDSCTSNMNYPAAYSNVGFVNYNSGYGGDYRLCTGVGTPDAACSGASAYVASSSTGGHVGADIDIVNAATSGVTTGTPDLDWFGFQIRNSTSSIIQYTAYSTGTCSGTVKNAAGTTVYSWGPDAGGAKDRTTTPTGLTAGQLHTVRVTCGTRYREAELRNY